ncbi:MAG: SPOR domain-containing protein [candidate division KSB1 bacterium]|nr:SPOR domain-containing protein [candidate division KSB1 bacterium]
MNEDFDPMMLKAPDFRIPPKQPAKSADPFVTLKPSMLDTSWQTVAGYQVQLLQTDDARLARETLKEAILMLETDVEIVFEAPYYKVRAGRFVSRYDAEQLQNLAAEKGYVNSWVIRTQVKVRASELLNPK